MQQLGGNVLSILEQLQRKKEENEKILQENNEIAKNNLFHKILNEWHQHKDIFFWQKVFKNIEFDILKDVYYHVLALQAENYPIKNPAGFFVATLKKLGYWPPRSSHEGTNSQKD